MRYEVATPILDLLHLVCIQLPRGGLFCSCDLTNFYLHFYISKTRCARHWVSRSPSDLLMDLIGSGGSDGACLNVSSDLI